MNKKYCADGLQTDHYVPFCKDSIFNMAYAKAIAPLDASKVDVKYRGYIIQWAVSHVRELSGDFVECGTYNAKAATLILNLEDFHEQKRIFHLFDTFSGIPPDNLTMREINLSYEGQYGDVTIDELKQKLIDYLDVVKFYQGVIPYTLSLFDGKKLSFIHMDLNASYATLKALEFFYPLLQPNGIILFDDYGWDGYEDQRDIIDGFFEDKAERLLVLPTGQAMIIKKEIHREAII